MRRAIAATRRMAQYGSERWVPTTTNDAALIRELPVSLDAPSPDALGDALADAVASAPLAVDPDTAGPAGFARVLSPGSRFQTWPAAVVDGELGLWDRLATPDDPSRDPLRGAGETVGRESVEVRPHNATMLPDAEVFVPDALAVAPAGGDVVWPGTVP